MKDLFLFFGLFLLLTFSVKAEKSKETEENLSIYSNSSILEEVAVVSEFVKIVEIGRDCRWRTCTYRNGILVGCSEWTYGICLDEMVIEG